MVLRQRLVPLGHVILASNLDHRAPDAVQPHIAQCFAQLEEDGR